MPGMYTWGEVLGIAGHAVRGGRQVVKNDDDSDGGHGDRSDRIYDKAQARRDRQANVAFNALDAAEDDLAQAEYDLRTADRGDKAAARKRRNDAKQKRNRANAAARRFN